MSGMHFSIATRASPLALRQAELVADALRASGHSCRLAPTKTTGDLAGQQPAAEGKEAFVDRVRALLLAGSCQLAVHSLKDLPTAERPGLQLIAVPPREEVADAVVAPGAADLQALPAGARIGTASLRRAALLQQAHPHLAAVELHGNVQTRLAKMRSGQCEALILAKAGLKRLDLLQHVSCTLPPEAWLCAPGQGALAVECRTEDAKRPDFAAAMRALEHGPTRACIRAERAFSAAMGADCRAPLGAWCRLKDNEMQLSAFIASDREIMQDGICAPPDSDGAALGRQLADRMLRAGAGRLLEIS